MAVAEINALSAKTDVKGFLATTWGSLAPMLAYRARNKFIRIEILEDLTQSTPAGRRAFCPNSVD